VRDSFHSFSGFLYGGAPAGGGTSLRRSASRRVRRWHPDFDGENSGSGVISSGNYARPQFPANADAAVDFVDMSAVVDRIHAAFFYNGR